MKSHQRRGTAKQCTSPNESARNRSVQSGNGLHIENLFCGFCGGQNATLVWDGRLARRTLLRFISQRPPVAPPRQCLRAMIVGRTGIRVEYMPPPCCSLWIYNVQLTLRTTLSSPCKAVSLASSSLAPGVSKRDNKFDEGVGQEGNQLYNAVLHEKCNDTWSLNRLLDTDLLLGESLLQRVHLQFQRP